MSKEKSLTISFSEKYGIKVEDLLPTLLNTAFKTKDGHITKEQMIALLVVADQYNLNPFTREIYAYPSKTGIVPVVGVDGWLRIINEHSCFDGISFSYSENSITPIDAKVSCPEWVDVTIHRKDRSVPTTVREYLDEVYREPFKAKGGVKNEWYTIDGAWQTHPKRMLRHKGIIQCARIAFSFGGIYDEDEAARIMHNESAVIDMGAAEVVQPSQPEPKPEPEVVVSANKTLDDEAVKLVVEKLLARLNGAPLKPLYDYIATQYCPETQKKILSVLEQKQQKIKATDHTEHVEQSSPFEGDEQYAEAVPADEFEPMAQSSKVDYADQFEQPSLTDGIGFY